MKPPSFVVHSTVLNIGLEGESHDNEPVGICRAGGTLDRLVHRLPAHHAELRPDVQIRLRLTALRRVEASACSASCASGLMPVNTAFSFGSRS